MRKITEEYLQTSPFLAPQAQTAIVPAPTAGWNAIDPVALMEPKYANILDNWVPRTGYVEVRPGYSAWAQNIAGSNTSPVESLMTYRPAGNERLFAACDGN